MKRCNIPQAFPKEESSATSAIVRNDLSDTVMFSALVETKSVSSILEAVKGNETPPGTTFGSNTEKTQSLSFNEKEVESKESFKYSSSSNDSTEALSKPEQPSMRQPSWLFRNANLTRDEEFCQLDRRLRTLPIEEDMFMFLSFFLGPVNGARFTKQIFEDSPRRDVTVIDRPRARG